uniref:Uncharacterized protein n=1 Tax=Ananas comosus var. bracteatus TaxID=296719 RepID=A0A6V7P2K5_ANACO|nr:unnamed protein product [Ananas comosus var. bracteatus]
MIVAFVALWIMAIHSQIGEWIILTLSLGLRVVAAPQAVHSRIVTTGARSLKTSLIECVPSWNFVHCIDCDALNVQGRLCPRHRGNSVHSAVCRRRRDPAK